MVVQITNEWVPMWSWDPERPNEFSSFQVGRFTAPDAYNAWKVEQALTTPVEELASHALECEAEAATIRQECTVDPCEGAGEPWCIHECEASDLEGVAFWCRLRLAKETGVLVVTNEWNHERHRKTGERRPLVKGGR